jgi:DNA-binding transcriptional MerR regulator
MVEGVAFLIVSDPVAGSVRIGELGRRTGVSPELLRAWERRYGLLRPSRSGGGFRLYSSEDERRVRAMTALISSGLAASEAAARALTDEQQPTSRADESLVEILATQLREALDDFDSQQAHAALDQLFAAVSIEVVLENVLIPYLRDLGERWERGDASVAQEHFASNLLRGRLLAFARDWASGTGPAYVLACPPGEEHDLPMIMFGIALSRRGARVVFLGADAPIDSIEKAVRATGPAAVVLAATRPERFQEKALSLRSLAEQVPVWICGSGAERSEAGKLGARFLEGDPVTAARSLA